ncbi:hypothetical protein H5T52_02435 [Candidatus Bipolaricaulota bacterium]|nr:hypothetical protein [Candidatus Bipolaricaulota bacterium]
MAMALWLKQGSRWRRAHALFPYLPPVYVRLFPSGRPGPSWKAAGEIRHCGADTLEELVRGLLSACRRPKGGASPGLWRLAEGDRLVPAPRIPPFDPQAVRPPGVELARLRQPPDRWLVTLHVARPSRGLLVASTERYLAPWTTALQELLKACN